MRLFFFIFSLGVLNCKSHSQITINGHIKNYSVDSLGIYVKFGSKYYELYNKQEIQKWFFEYRIRELKANMLYELMENAFGANLIAPEYQSKQETQLLKKIHDTY